MGVLIFSVPDPTSHIRLRFLSSCRHPLHAVDINIKSVCKNVFNFPRAKRDSLLSSARPFFPFFYGVSSLVELLAFLFFSQRQCAARPPVDTKLLSQKPPKMNEKKVFYETRDKLLWWQRKATILGCAKQSQ